MVYMRDIVKPSMEYTEQLRHLALVAQVCYGSFDLTLRCMLLLAALGALPRSSPQEYLHRISVPR